MIIHGPLSNIAFNNFTALNDDELISELIHTAIVEWDSDLMRIEVSVCVTEDDKLVDTTYILNTAEEVSQFHFENLRHTPNLANFSIRVETLNSLNNDILNSYIGFVFNPTGEVDSLMLGMNELSNSYFGTYQYGKASRPFNKFPLIGLCPSPLLGVIDGAIVCGISFPVETHITSKLTTFGDAVVSLDKDRVLKQWREFCLKDSTQMCTNSSKLKTFGKDPRDAVNLKTTFTVQKSKIVDALVNDYDSSNTNYKLINGYNDLLVSVLSDGYKAIEEQKG